MGNSELLEGSDRGTSMKVDGGKVDNVVHFR